MPSDQCWAALGHQHPGVLGLTAVGEGKEKGDIMGRNTGFTIKAFLWMPEAS